ncbi:GNAT family N-acetyltransferase [Actinomadura sp. KC06]|uniref:GNAT family N-acetyltransferase n=1 Tax=Actinomadura sp. KC06 TaxID=2530369 RepID=UPI00104C4640|nr:GNAT family N-acetyltransferase [Actinomadura sp. KC06]TDD37406.1 GNAT family N-acetyltransferase [Actinomadura sp. KC06]
MAEGIVLTRSGYRIRLALPDEIGIVLGLIDDAAAWLRSKHTTQWRSPWPSADQRWKRVHEALLNRETWLLLDAERPIGTVSIRSSGHMELWTPEERAVEAVYLHRLVIDRAYAGAGLGAELIGWAGREGASRQRDARLIRIDVWTDNVELHAYYRRLGFRHVAIRTTSDRTPSGALFERPLDPPEPARHPRITKWPGH